MFDMISRTDVPSKIANKYKYAIVFETETGERFTVYRNDHDKMENDIKFYGHEKFVSVVSTH